MQRGVITLDDAKTGIILGAIKSVRRYGLEGVRIQNISELAGISSGAIYRVEAISLGWTVVSNKRKRRTVFLPGKLCGLLKSI